MRVLIPVDSCREKINTAQSKAAWVEQLHIVFVWVSSIIKQTVCKPHKQGNAGFGSLTQVWVFSVSAGSSFTLMLVIDEER